MAAVGEDLDFGGDCRVSRVVREILHVSAQASRGEYVQLLHDGRVIVLVRLSVASVGP